MPSRSERDLQVEWVELDKIQPYFRNPRNITDEAIDGVAQSIKQFGFKNPILVDKDYVIIAGHTRRLASQKLKLEKVPVIVCTDLSDKEAQALRLADNKVGELAEWDFPALDIELSELKDDFDMSDFGFGDEEESKGIGGSAREKGEVEFTEVLNEEHNYIVLYFDNDIDWLQAESLLGLKQVKALLTNKEGKEKKNFNRVGVGRVMKGSEAIRKIQEGYKL